MASRSKKRKSKASKKSAVTQAAPAKNTMNITHSVLAHARNCTKERVKVFTNPVHPKGVVPKAATIAMDTQIPGVQDWANNYGSDSFISEGLTFLGYAYLSELAQRPEYRMMSETIASEMTRKWIQFTSGEDDDDEKAERINELEAEFKRLNVRDLFCRATEQDGFFGRGHIYIDTGDTEDADELTKSIGDGWDEISKAKIKKQPIKALRNVEAIWCYPSGYNTTNPLLDNWYRPDKWYVQGNEVHSSRFLTFIGREVPDILKPTYSFGGLSLSQMAKPYVDNWLQTRQSVNDIISAFSVFVLKSNLAETLQADGEQLFRRATLFNAVRDNRGLMMIDKETEEFDNVSAPLSGLDALQSQAQEHMASVSHIPIVKLLGIQPAGLNASSEDQMRVFYDYINSYQEHLYRDQLRRLLGIIMLSLWGEVDDTIDFEFIPLWSLDEKGQAEVRKIKAETDQVYVDTGAIAPEEVRTRIANDPGSDYAAIDVDDVPNLLDEEEQGLAPKGGHPLEGLAEKGKSDDTVGDRLFGKATAA